MNNHTQIIQSIFLACDHYENYLELGVYIGETLDSIRPYAKMSVGVDIVDHRVNKQGNFFIGTTQDFFRQNQSTFDMIFIDADHSFDAVRCDFEESIKILNSDGTIVLHDTAPRNEYLLQPGYCGDSYRMNDYLLALDQYTFVTLPINEAGLTLVRRKSDMRFKSFV